MQFATLSETHIFSPALLNTLRVSFSRNLVSGESTTSPRITDPGTILQPGQDMALIIGHCSRKSDPELRREVESLLAQEKGAGFLESPAL